MTGTAGGTADARLEDVLAELGDVSDPAFPAVSEFDRRLPVFTRSNAGEIFPGVTMPATWASVGHGLERSFVRAHTELGVIPTPADATLRYIGLFYGRVALCLSAHAEVNRRSFGAPWWPFGSGRVTRGGVDSAAYVPPDSLRTWAGDLVWRLRAQRSVRRVEADLPGRVEALAAEVESRSAQAVGIDPAAASLDDLLDPGGRSALGGRLLDAHLQVTFFAGSYYALLERLLRAWTERDPAATAPALLTGIGAVESARPAQALAEMAHTVRAAPRLAALLAAGDLDGFAHALDGAAGAREERVVAERAAFLARYGYRAVAEAAIETRTWGEDPRQVDRALAAHVGGGAPARAPGSRAAREALEAAVLAGLSARRRTRLSAAIAGARRFTALRERTKSLTVRNGARNKALSRELGRRLVEKALLASPRDVALLTREELRALAGGDAAVAALVTRRRRSVELCELLDLPTETFTAPPRPRLRAAQEGAQPAGMSREVLLGMGVSPGRAEGVARVITDPRQESAIATGEILVAPYTDAAWAPLLMLAAAVVVDTGGMISHGAIVARELGLPAVVNVPGTRRLRTGDRIAVDGSRGTVEILDTAAP